MRRSLKTKFILSYLAVALLTVLVVSVVIRLTSGQSLMNLVVEQQTALLSESVQTYYTSTGSLDGFFDYYLRTSRRPPSPDLDGPDKYDRGDDLRGVYGLVDTEYRVLMPTFGYDIGQTLPQDRVKQAVPVKVDGETIAWILPDTSREFSLSAEEMLFLKRTNLAIGLSALAGVLAAVSMGYLLVGGLLKPIRRLTQAAQDLARGNLQQQVPVTSQDELGLLTTTFNQMSADLARVDEQRKRLTADITHDLSTPLQIIAGYIEMLEEGEVVLTPQRLEIIKTEMDHLRRLVNDLTTLTQVEAGGLEIQSQPLDATGLLRKVHQAYLPIAARQGVELRLEVPGVPVEMLADEMRLMQVLKNLVDNALRYTPGGGSITLGLKTAKGLEIWVSDNGSGIEAEDLPFVFDRFYRADKTRSGSTGKMGLGLAICKALVTAQGGTITAESGGRGQGATMRLRFSAYPVPPQG